MKFIFFYFFSIPKKISKTNSPKMMKNQWKSSKTIKNQWFSLIFHDFLRNYFWRSKKNKIFQFHLKQNFLSNILSMKYPDLNFYWNRNSRTWFARAICSSGNGSKILHARQALMGLIMWVRTTLSRPIFSKNIQNSYTQI